MSPDEPKIIFSGSVTIHPETKPKRWPLSWYYRARLWAYMRTLR